MNTNNDTVLLEVNEQGIATVTLNNPEKHNALDRRASCRERV